MDRTRSLKFLLGLGIGAIAYALLGAYDPQQRAVGAIFAFTVVLWATEALNEESKAGSSTEG